MKVYSIGTATLDIFFVFDNLNFLKKPNLIKEKNNVPKLFIDVGGGGLNAAFNFKNLNLEEKAIVKLGKDFIGEIIENKANKKGINLEIIKTKGDSSLSVIFLNQKNGEKFIFTYRGDEIFKTNEIFIDNNSAYFLTTGITPLKVWEEIVLKIKKKNNFLGIVPSKSFLNKKQAYKILNKCDVVVFNEEEAKILIKNLRGKKSVNLIEEVNNLLKDVKYKIITFGKKGALLIFENKAIFCESYKKVKIVDTTGAGDCFASTFFGLLIKNLDNINIEILKNILKLASVNTAFNLREIGTQTGLLREKELLKFINIPMRFKVLNLR